MIRFVKIVKSTLSNNDIGSLEERVNRTVRNISDCGGKVVSFYTETFGLSPMNMFVFVIYEYSEELTDAVIRQKLHKDKEKVVLLVNDPKGNYQNGTIATITGLTTGGSDSLFDDEITSVSVKVPNGRIIEIERHTFTKYEYVVDTIEVPKTDRKGNVLKDDKGNILTRKVKELMQKEIGSAEQFPMRLGYAVTIHKSQGQTYDRMNLIPEIFATGQLYVALSRCRTAENICIVRKLTKGMVRTSSEVLDFYSDSENYTFFNKDEAMKAMFIPLKYVHKVEQFIAELMLKDDTEKSETESVFSKFKKNTEIVAVSPDDIPF